MKAAGTDRHVRGLFIISAMLKGPSCPVNRLVIVRADTIAWATWT